MVPGKRRGFLPRRRNVSIGSGSCCIVTEDSAEERRQAVIMRSCASARRIWEIGGRLIFPERRAAAAVLAGEVGSVSGSRNGGRKNRLRIRCQSFALRGFSSCRVCVCKRCWSDGGVSHEAFKLGKIVRWIHCLSSVASGRERRWVWTDLVSHGL